MKKLVIYLVVVLALVMATDAQSRNAALLVSHHPRHATLRQIEASQQGNISHNHYVCRHGGGWNQIRSCKALVWLKREYKKTEAKLHPKVTASVGHWAGWACITNGATPTSAHEGNGYNGSYTGRLGMTTPWAGHYPQAGKDWVHSDISYVYSVAEQEASKHKWSPVWMAGQWPQTYPPCAGYFN